MNKVNSAPEPVATASKTNEDIFDKFKDCTICLEAFENGDKVKIMPQCSHIFHEKCCLQWLDFKFTCPNCNLAIDLRPRRTHSEARQDNRHPRAPNPIV